MPVITRLELENAQRDVVDLGLIINGAADRPNPPQDPGTVTTRLGGVVKTISRLVVEGQETVEARLTPIIYTSTIERLADITLRNVGQTCFDKEDTNLYIVVEEMIGDPTPVATKVWNQISNLQLAVSADLDQLLRQDGAVGRITIDDWKFLDERDKLYDGNALEVHHISFPGKSTLNEGLAKAVGYPGGWPTAHHLQQDIHYGPRIPIVDMKVASVEWPDWDNTIKRVQVRNNNPNEIREYYIVGYIDINSAYDRAVYVEDCYIDPNFGAFQAISKANESTYPLFVQYCKLRRVLNEAAAPNYGHIAFCDIEVTRGDGLKATGHDVNLHGNMIRLLGQLESAHADGIQISTCDKLQITSNTIYMPGTGLLEWDEGTYGTTQCLRLVTESDSHAIKECYVAGNVFVGGGFTLAIRSRYTNSVVENVAIVNNVIGNSYDGDFYNLFGPITQEHWKPGSSPGFFRNLMIWGNVMNDGTVLAAEGGGGRQTGTDQQGIWHFSKEHASPRWLEIGKRHGLLDWNGDLAPGVTNRTTG